MSTCKSTWAHTIPHWRQFGSASNLSYRFLFSIQVKNWQSNFTFSGFLTILILGLLPSLWDSLSDFACANTEDTAMGLGTLPESWFDFQPSGRNISSSSLPGEGRSLRGDLSHLFLHLPPSSRDCCHWSAKSTWTVCNQILQQLCPV